MNIYLTKMRMHQRTIKRDVISTAKIDDVRERQETKKLLNAEAVRSVL